MEVASQIFYWIRPYLGYTAYIILFVLFAVFGYFLTRKALRKRAVKEEEGTSEESKENKSASIFSLKRSFVKGLRVLKSNVLGGMFRYKIPWFMIIGESGSGKSTLLSHTGLNLPVGRPDEDNPGKAEGCKWWFFDQGIMLDVLGDFILRKDGKSSDPKGWQSFLRLLQKHRSQRPIDGVILTVPCTELMGPHQNLSERNVQAAHKAAEIYEKFFIAQKILGIRFPVYLLITQCDRIRGFKSFSQELPKNLHDDIFGWSSPYTLETAYNPQWIDEAFQSLYKDLYQTQLEVIVDGIQVQDSDSFFMFPSEFQSMREPIRAYLNTLFKQSVYHEPFYFRGIYFCGDGEGEESTWSLPNTAAPQIEPTIPPETGGGQVQNIFFLKDLFEKKIFPEFQLACPTKKIFRWRTRTTWAVRSALAAMALFWVLGIFFSYDHLYETKATLIPVLRDLKSNLIQLQVTGSEEEDEMERDFFDKSALNLLEGMTEIQSNSPRRGVARVAPGFNSFFIPSSWNSNIDEMIQRTMVLAYDKIILKSIFFGLQQKLGRIIDENEALLAMQRQKTRDIKHLTLTQIPEYIQLRQMVQDLNLYGKNIENYNSLSTSQDLSAIGNLIKYLFGTTLPENFYKNAYYYHNALRDVEYGEFDTRVDKFLVTIPKIRNISQGLFEKLFETNPLLQDLQNFSEQLYSLQTIEGQADIIGEKRQMFEAILTSIQQLEAQLALSENVWLSRDTLDLGSNFNKVLASIGSSPFLGGKLRRELEDTGQDNFQLLKDQLREQKTELTGPILARRDNRILMQLSPTILELKGSLENFLNQPFMASVATKYDFISEISQRNRIIWDESLLNSAIVLHRQYEKFERNRLPQFPKNLQSSVRQTALNNLESQLLIYIGEAQEVQTLPAQTVSFVRPEQDLSFEIRNFRKNAQRLGRLTDIFNSLDFTDSSWMLSNFVTTHAFYLLSSVNQLLEDEGLYHFRDNSFDWWNGQAEVSLTAYDVRDTKELNYYLSVQRERISHLAREYAEPLLMFLLNRTIHRDTHEEKLVSKWQRILRELEYYDAKKTRNSLAQLEKFIIFDMGKTNPGNCETVLTEKSLSRTSGDFFEDKYYSLRHALLDQCLNLASNQVFREYSAIETFFNQYLAGRFPFVENPSEPIRGEADPERIRKFYWILDGYLKNQIQLLEQSSEFGLSGEQTLVFLYQLEEAKPFFESFLETKKPFQTPLYLLDVDFRVNQANETGGNQIIHWEFETGGQQRNNRMTQSKPLEWVYGRPIKISLRWAKDGSHIPVKVTNPEGDITGRTVTYEFENLWSLPRLLARFMAGPEDFQRPGNEKPHTLKFAFQTREWNEEEAKKDLYLPKTSESQVFIRVGVKNPKEKKMLVFPQLPGKAPHLKKDFQS